MSYRGQNWVLVVAIALGACSDDDSSAQGLADGGQPAHETTVEVVPGSRQTPLVASVRVHVPYDASVRVEVDDDVRQWQVVAEAQANEPVTIGLVGLKFDREHRVRIFAQLDDGSEIALSEQVTFDTPARPPHLPPFELVHVEPGRSEPGWTYFSLVVGGPVALPDPWGALVAVDDQGDVVWYHEVNEVVGDHKILNDGRVLYILSNRKLIEIDALGNVMNRWFAGGQGVAGAHADAVIVDTDTFHHEIIELTGDGPADFLTLGTELRTVAGYPADPESQTPAEMPGQVVGDVILEFDREGQVHRRWSLLDILDPLRVSYDGTGDFWAPFYGWESRDWSHGNSVALTASGDAYLVSMRHQDAVVKVDRATGQLHWIFGDPSGWREPWRSKVLAPAWDGAGEGQFSYHQHGCTITEPGHVLLFDNGNGRAIAPAAPLGEDETYSRAVEYSIDAEAGTVAQTWQYRGSAMYSSFLGDVDLLPETGNILVTSGAEFAQDSESYYARILEVDREGDNEVVFELQVGHYDAPTGSIWGVFRADRLPAWESAP